MTIDPNLETYLTRKHAAMEEMAALERKHYAARSRRLAGVDLTALDSANAALQSDTHAAKSVKTFGAAAASALHALAASPTPTPTPTPTPVPVPTPPPNPAGIIDDMRAFHMNSLSSVLVNTGAQDTVVDHNGNPYPGYVVKASMDPAGFWTEILCVDNDITLVTDPVYGRVYRHRNTGDSHNPYWSTPGVASTSLIKERKITIGQWDWYALRILWESTWDWSKTDWSVVLQCAYPTISSPPLGIYAGYGDNIYIERWAGPVTVKGEADIWNVRKQSDIQGKWYEAILGVKWGSNNDGEIHFLDRCKGLGESAFTERIAMTGKNTWQWGGSAPQNPSNFSVVDKQDCYRGYKAGYTDDNIPANYVQHSGYARCADKTTALAVLGG